MGLLDLIYPEHQVISIIGMGKNAGKTTVLNHLVQEATNRDICLGLTSTGRDGEEEDIVTKTEKPTIYAGEGTIIATTKELLMKAEAKIEILEITPYQTSLGRVILGKVRWEGLVELAGPDVNCYTKEVTKKMKDYGAELVIVDGAVDRRTAASPAITEGTILVTGAVISRNIDTVVEETLHQIELLQLPVEEDLVVRDAAFKIQREKGYGIIDAQGDIKPLMIRTALNSGKTIGSGLDENSRYVVLSGCLVSKTLEEIIQVTHHYSSVVLLVQDATKIFINRKSWQILKRKGIKIRVIDPIKVLAVALNPFAPQGYGFDPGEFHWRMKKGVGSLPVINVMQEV